MSFHRITLTINGETELVDVPSNLTLLQMLREKLALTGTKNGCAAGECGACTVMLNGEPVNSCMILAVECDGASIVTVEGLADDGRLDPVQEALIEQGGVKVDGARVESVDAQLPRQGSCLIQVGKRRFLRVKFA